MIELREKQMVLRRLSKSLADNNLDLKSKSISQDNILSILEITRKEVPYCRILLYLIQNYWHSFEKMVLGNCCENEKLILSETEHQCDAPCDKYEKEGRMDIFLKTERHVVVIEVKIDAGDQECQLVRYKKQLEKSFKKYKKHIYYLTLDGSVASEYSLKCNKCESKCDLKSDYTCISFCNDIYNWVQSLVTDEEVHSIKKDFLEVLEMIKSNEQEYINFLKESVDYPKVVFNLYEAIPKLWEEIRAKFFSEIANVLKTKYGFTEEKNAQSTFNKEIWELALTKEDGHLYFCYETNFFFRKGIEEKEWTYLNAEVFESTSSPTDYSTNKAANAFDVKKFDKSSTGLLDWYYETDEKKKKRIIENAAFTANEFFDKK